MLDPRPPPKCSVGFVRAWASDHVIWNHEFEGEERDRDFNWTGIDDEKAALYPWPPIPGSDDAEIEAAIDDLLKGDDHKFDRLKY